MRDGLSVTKTNRGSQALGAAVGAAAVGGVGAIVGGLSGSSTTLEKIRKIAVRIIVDDPPSPIHDIVLFDGKTAGLNPTDPAIQQCAQKAAEISARVSSAIRHMESAAVLSAQPAAAPQSAGSSQEIAVLWELKKAGALSEREFEEEKRKVLGATDR